ncbi:hypothetical protein QKU48_gp0327 [Fadolivirus algeromassiliense]|jgi:hypothetical protein|uniref:Uncharacterized protein n=1 Tax=Fadolivirus FV1/VV64 TaxID=3070911 RepID=A0A7D3QU13_9VIRU|nr:hypothetical protein QKU48_gp0327 [Fadolivirus algeromassiliense]QKF93785.1 hypothetical protein Fadolivirus_1_327 [Fadolivirus FV1/VV64]
MTTYKFVNNFDNSYRNTNLISFYQVGSFPHPKNGKYHLRKFVINDDNNFVQVKEYLVDKKIYTKFLQRKKSNEYKMYSVYDLGTVNYPSMSDVLLLKSDVLKGNYNYYGYAPF